MNDSLDVADKYIAAGSPEASVQDLELWAEDASASIRRRVAENSRTPLHSLIKLANDASSDVKIAVSENPFTPAWLIEDLCTSEDDDLRYSIAENFKTPKVVLNDLCEDENPYVAHRAHATLKRLEPLEKKLRYLPSFDKVAESLECIWQVKIS